MSNTVYYNECHHLYCDDIEDRSCLKRYFNVFNPLKQKQYRIAVCNEFIRLKYQEYRSEDRNLSNYIRYYESRWYERVVKEILEDEMKLYPKSWTTQSFQIKKKVFISIPICERPYLYYETGLFDYMKTLSPCEHFGSVSLPYNINEAIKNRLSQVLSTMSGYMAYKVDHRKIKALIKKLNEGYGLYLSNEFMVDFFDLLIKYKLNK